LVTTAGWLIIGFLGLSELILIALFAIGIIIIPLPGRLFARRGGGHTVAGGKPVQWSGKFRTVPIKAIHTAAEAFFCSYSRGEYTLMGREQFRLTFHRGPWQDSGGGQLVPIAYAGARADELPVILRVVMQPQARGLLITVRHEVIPPDKLPRQDKQALTARFKGEVAAFQSYLKDNFVPPEAPPEAPRPRKRITVRQKDA
jgi:hypothetical protein